MTDLVDILVVVFETQSAFTLHDDSLSVNHVIARTHFNIDIVQNAIPHILGIVEVAGHVRGRAHNGSNELVFRLFEPHFND